MNKAIEMLINAIGNGIMNPEARAKAEAEKIKAETARAIKVDKLMDDKIRRVIIILLAPFGIEPGERYNELIDQLVSTIHHFMHDISQHMMEDKDLIELIHTRNQMDSGKEPDMQTMLKGLEHMTNIMRVMKQAERRMSNDERAERTERPEPIEERTGEPTKLSDILDKMIADMPDGMAENCAKCDDTDCPAHPSNRN